MFTISGRIEEKSLKKLVIHPTIYPVFHIRGLGKEERVGKKEKGRRGREAREEKKGECERRSEKEERNHS